jgi:SAM-dependent methyltransferase
MQQHYYDVDRRDESVLSTIAHSLISDILAIYSQKTGNEPHAIVALDVGCGYGLYAEELAKNVKKVVAVEPYHHAWQHANKKTAPKLSFINSTIENFKTKERFDLVLMITTQEHMSDQERAFKNVFELVKNGGMIYLTAPNKLWPVESHYKLPFLSYLPLPLANFYVRVSGKGASYEDCSYSKTYWGIRKLLQQFPCTFSFELPDPSSPYLGMGTNNRTYHALKNIGISLIRRFPVLWIVSKGFIVVIQKQEKKR